MYSGARPHKAVGGSLYLHYGIIFLAALVALAPQFILPGYYHMFALDAAMLPKYVSEFSESFRQGILYPRWMADDFRGYGSPVFVLYSPLLYFICSLISFSGLGLVFIITVIKLFSVFIGAVFLYHFMRGRFGEKAALAGALFYTLMPTRIFDLYMQNTPAGRFAETFLPICIFFAGKLVDGPSRRVWLVGLAMTFAGLILSHLATAYMFVPFLVGCGIVCRREVKISQALFRLSLGLTLGMLLASFFLVPVLFERGLTHLEYLKIAEGYKYWRHFIFAGSYQRFFPWLDVFYGLLGRSILLEVCTLSVMGYFVRAGTKSRYNRETTFFIFASIFCLFMMSWLSAPLWERISSLRTLAFSSRFDVFYMVFISMLLGIAAGRLAGRERRQPRVSMVLFIIILGLLFYGGVLIKSAHPFSEEDVKPLFSYPYLQQEYLPMTVSLDSLESLGSEADPDKSGSSGPSGRLFSADVPFRAVVGKWGYVDRGFRIETAQNATVRIKTFYFPGWRAWVDGRQTRLWAEDRTGAILMDVPAGRHEVDLKFTDTMPRAVGKVLSLITLIALMSPYGRVKRLLTHA